MPSVTLAGIESRAGFHLVNEDRSLCEPELPLYAVLDGEGNGGHAADVASAILRAHMSVEREVRANGTESALAEAVEEANRAIFEASRCGPGRGSGTTLTCCVLAGTTLHVAHVGDSRLYHLRQGSWRLLTRDHSLVEDTRRSGPLADMADLLACHSNVITRAVGVTPTVAVDAFSLGMSPGDFVLLCTDGAWRPFDPDLAGEPPPLLEASTLLRHVFECFTLDGERDDATALLLSF
jgi:serine/threonine protein phosphatase PrpC